MLVIFYIAHSIFATAFWPCVGCAGHTKKRVGSAFGILNCLDAIFCGVFTILLSKLGIEVISCLVCSGITVILLAFVWYIDASTGFTLDGLSSQVKKKS